MMDSSDQKLREQLRRKEREVAAVLQISQSLLQRYKVDDLVKNVLLVATEIVGADASSILLADPGTKDLVFRYVIGEKGELLAGKVISMEQGIAGTVFNSGRPLIIPDAKQDARHLPVFDSITGYSTRDMIVLPLKGRNGESIGVLEVLNKRDGTLGEEDLAILTILAALASEAIEGARLAEEAKLAEVVRLLGDLSHDVKNLLTPVVMGANILQSEIPEIFRKASGIGMQASQERCNQVIDILSKSARQLQDRVKELADCVKGVITPAHFAPCVIGEIVESVFATHRLLSEEKRISLRMDGLDRLPTIVGDQSRLFNAFYNLINNALQEVSPGGAITVRGDVEEEVIWVRVTDTGRGMPPMIRDSLFSVRVISRKVGGTGLGTKIVKDVVEAHGGLITVESQEGQGTTFHIRLPIRPGVSKRG